MTSFRTKSLVATAPCSDRENHAAFNFKAVSFERINITGCGYLWALFALMQVRVPAIPAKRER